MSAPTLGPMSTRPFLNCYSSADVRTTADRLGSPMFSAAAHADLLARREASVTL